MKEQYRLTYSSVRNTERGQAICRLFSGTQVSSDTLEAANEEFVKTRDMMQLIALSGDAGIVYGVLTLIALHTANVARNEVICGDPPDA